MEDDTNDVKIDIKSRMATLIGHTFPDDFSYAEEIEELHTNDPENTLAPRLYLDIGRVAQCDRVLWQTLLSNPIVALPACEEALSDALSNVDRYPEIVKLLKQTGKTVRIGLTGHFGPYMVSPRLLSCLRVNKTVCLVGIVTRTTTVRPKVVRSVHYCQATKEYISREYRDVTSNLGAPTTSVYPTRDEAGNLLETEFGLCSYVNSHVASMQELPELSPPGMLPRTVEIVLEDDLADSCKPGDRIFVVGILKPIVPKSQPQIKSHLKSVVVANSITHTITNVSDTISREDLRRIKHIAEGSTPLDVLASSLAPTIYGHEMIKKGLILLMIGGEEKNLTTGTHLRGDINCLLVGDPGTAKSQLLRAVMEVCPRSISTTGRGSTGVGLTAAITTDFDTGEKRLEAGAMVLADRGIVCIDEFDKMSDVDRVAIHEVMEQQTVTITKSGVKASLNARCSVIAAANPIYGNYDHNITIARNVNLPDSLLSRFDMLFIVLDERDRDHDRRISKFILDRHVEQSGDPGAKMTNTVHSWHYQQTTERQQTTDLRRSMHERTDTNGLPPIDPEFLRKYIFYAKQLMSGKIQLTAKATELISEMALPITPRTLETIIRLATAHAKLRLSTQIETLDVKQAKNIMDVVLNVETTDPQDAPTHELSSLRKPHSVPRRGDRSSGKASQDENADANTVAEAEDTPTINSFIPAKGDSARRSGDEMDVTVVIQSMTDLSDDHKRAIHTSIGEVLESKPYGLLSDVHDGLIDKGLSIETDCLAAYLTWIAENYESHPELHLPQILYDANAQEFFDVS